jgi:hypothetical protein
MEDKELEEYFENGFDPEKCDSTELLEEYHRWLKTASKEKIDLEQYEDDEFYEEDIKRRY